MNPAAAALLYLAAAGAMLLLHRLWVQRIEQRAATEISVRGFAWLGAGGAYGAALVGATVAAIAMLGGGRCTGVRLPASLGVDLCAWITIAVGQEIVFRGLILRLLERRLGWWVAAAVSGGLYGLIHLVNPHATLWAALALALESLGAYAAVWRLNRSLWAVIGVHFAWNAAEASLFGLPDSGVLRDGMLRLELDGPSWLTGGSFGPEASPAAVAVCLLGGAILLAVRRPHA